MTIQQAEIAKNIDEIQAQAVELRKRFSTFIDKLNDIGRDITRLNKSFNAAVGSAQSPLLPQGRHFAELPGQSSEIDVSDQIAEVVREIQNGDCQAAVGDGWPSTLMYLPLYAQMLAVPRDVITMASASGDAGAAQTIMDAHDFDVLPVATDRTGGLIATYWHRRERSGLQQCFPVLAEDMLPGQTPIEVALDVILRADKPFVFIRDRLRVTGLLGLSDFNGNAFRVYVFYQVVMLEMLLSRFIEHKLGNDVVEQQISQPGREQLQKDRE